MDAVRDAWVEIDRKKLCHNFMEVRRAVAPGVKICAVLKAQCYGLGGAETAKLLDSLGADMFAVAILSEALELRAALPDKEILVLGYVSERGYDCAIENRISLTMYREEAIRALRSRAAALGKTARIHLKINTGMNRLGFSPTPEGVRIAAACMQQPDLEVRGIFTHLAAADRYDKSIVNMQIARFDAFLALLQAQGAALPPVHISASPAVCSLPELDRDMVRPGLLLTGFYTSDEVSRNRIWLQPCVKLKARLGNILSVKAGEGVGYDFTCRLSRDTTIGLLPLGFSDGFSRTFSNRFFVTIRGHRCPVIGNICMDHCMLDLSAVPKPEIGEEIVVYGDGSDGPDGAMSIQEAAELRGTIVDEVLTNLSPRLPRIYV